MKDKQLFFTMPRKMIAAMTQESWERIPHVTLTYEAAVENLLATLKEHNKKYPGMHITLNTAILKLIAECLGAAPKMNGHIHYNRWLVSGKITLFSNVDISVPVRFSDGMMIPLTLRDLGNKSMREIGLAMEDAMRRAENSKMEEVMFDLSFYDTMQELKRFRIIKAAGRLIGALADRRHLGRLSIRERKAYRQIPEDERLTRHDLEQGTITVSNMGALYREWQGGCQMLEIVPPQLAVIGVGPLRGHVLTLTIAFDHRALDFDDITPFMRRMDEILSNPLILQKMV